MKTIEIKELLRCALINIDNIAKGISPQIAKMQIQEALRLVEDDQSEETT